MKNLDKRNFISEFEHIWGAFYLLDGDLMSDIRPHCKSLFLKIESSPICTPLKTEIVNIPLRYLEPLEFYLRIRYPQNQLTKKVHAISYIVEVNKKSFDFYFLRQSSLIKTYFKIISIPFEMLLKFVIGFIVCKRYKVV